MNTPGRELSPAPTAAPESNPPLAQPGELATYGDGSINAATTNAATAPPAYTTTPTAGNTLPPSLLSSILSALSSSTTGSTFSVPLSSLTAPTEPVITVLTVKPFPFITTLTPTTQGTPSSIAVSAATLDSATPTTTIPPAAIPPTLSSTTTTRNSTDPGFHIPSLGIKTEGLPSSIPLPRASAAMHTCATLPGGIQPTGGIDKGCGALFAHVVDCFAASEPWSSPYDAARNGAYQRCVCMTSPANPFTENSALWKNFSGCAACVYDLLDGEEGLDVQPWVTLETRRLWGFCRAQEPSAFMFTLFLRNWFYRLDDFNDVDPAPFAAAWPEVSGIDAEGMPALQAHWTGAPPLANLAWGPSAAPEWKYDGATPELSTFMTEASVYDIRVTELASRLVTWVPTQAGQTWGRHAAEVMESRAADRLVESALCVGPGNGKGCQINSAGISVTDVTDPPNHWRWMGIAVVGLVAAVI